MSVWVSGRRAGTAWNPLQEGPGRSARHHTLNDLVAQAMVSAGIPVTRELHRLNWPDGKRPDWFHGKRESHWHATWPSFVCLPTHMLLVKLVQQQRKYAKYTVIESSYIFQPIAIESLHPVNASGHTLPFFCMTVLCRRRRSNDRPCIHFFLCMA